MCGRVTLTKSAIRDVADELDAEIAAEDEALYRPRYNVAPSDLHWILEPSGDRRVLVPAAWGYFVSGARGSSAPSPSGKPPAPRSLINVRGEQVGSGAGFRQAFAERRCAVVTDGFFEWNKARQPFWYHRPDGALLLLAGLFQTPADAPPSSKPSSRPRFTILTTRPNRLVAEVHDRMPVVLAPEHVDEWLSGEPARAARLIATAPDDALTATAVSRRVGSVKNDDPACLLPASADAETGGAAGSRPDDRQRRLFDS